RGCATPWPSSRICCSASIPEYGAYTRACCRAAEAKNRPGNESAVRRQGRRLDVGDRGIGITLEHDLLPGRSIGEQRAQQLVVERVAGFVAGELPDQAVPEQVEVPDRIEDLVLDELVLVAQPVLVQDAEVIEHDRVVEAAAERQVAGAHGLEVA